MPNVETLGRATAPFAQAPRYRAAVTVGHTVIALVGGALVLDLRLGFLSSLQRSVDARRADAATTRD